MLNLHILLSKLVLSYNTVKLRNQGYGPYKLPISHFRVKKSFIIKKDCIKS